MNDILEPSSNFKISFKDVEKNFAETIFQIFYIADSGWTEKAYVNQTLQSVKLGLYKLNHHPRTVL